MKLKTTATLIRNYSFKELIRAVIFHPLLCLRGLFGRPISDFSKKEIYKLLPTGAVIIEAGCADGSDTLQFSDRFPDSRILALEPLPELYEVAKLRFASHPNIVLYKLALSPDSAQTKILYAGPIDKVHQSASLLMPTSHSEYYPSIVFEREIDVKTISLSDLIEMNQVKYVDLLWLDLQGLELSILESVGNQVLERIGVVHTEVSRFPLYDGAPSYKEVIKYMIDNGFELVKIRMPLTTGNAIFVNKLDKSELIRTSSPKG